MDQDSSAVALSMIPGLGGCVGKLLLEEFGSPGRILAAEREELEAIHGVGPRLSRAIRRGPDPKRLREDLESVARAGAVAVGLGDDRYPFLLAEIGDPPLVLYVLGRPLDPAKPRVAIVGTRTPSSTGLSLARELARDLARVGVEVVSGLARGIDSAAHMGALEGGGSTVAVLGCGVDVLYPMRRSDLRERIGREGTLISEFPMRTTPVPEFFPRRNRVISGLASVVVVVEAAERSGALLTADLALDQGREVMAVPGNPRSRVSAGPNRLLQEGAKLVMSVDDIVEEMPGLALGGAGCRAPDGPEPGARGAEELAILDSLASGASLVDDLATKTGLGVSVLLEKLLALELRGLVTRVGGAHYERVTQ